MGGGNELEHRRRAAAADPAMAPQPIVPGKSTGVPIVDHGTVCDRHPERNDCWLDDNDRTRLLLALSVSVGAAMDNFHAAIGNVRTELLTMTKGSAGSWGLFAEILFGVGSSGIVGLLTKSIGAFAARAGKVATAGEALTIGDGYELSAALAKQVAKVKPAHIGKILVTASKGVRTALKNAAHRPKDVSAADAAAADFCTVLEEELAPMTNHIVLEAPTKLDDFEIAAMVASYQDPDYHSVAAYEAVVRDLVDRFKAQRLSEIGDGLSTGTDQMSDKKVVKVLGAGGASRFALVEFYRPIYGEHGTAYHRTSGAPAHWDQPEFLSWIDTDLAPVAISTQFDRYGDVPVLDATAKATGMDAIDTWAASP